jgi:hypothetical protein
MTRTHAHEVAVQYVSGSPGNFGHLLRQPEDVFPLVTPVVGGRESLGNDGSAEDISQPSASDSSFDDPESTITASDRSVSELSREHDGQQRNTVETRRPL